MSAAFLAMSVCLLYCEGCQKRHPKHLEESDFHQFLKEGVLEAYCEECRQITPWVLALPARRMPELRDDSVPHRILAIDDDEDTLRVLKLALRPEGHAVSVANSTDKAIKLLQDEEFDIVVADIRMPGFDGKSLFRFLAVHLPYYIQKVAFLTGDKSDDTRRFLLESRCPYLFKPVGVHQLPSLIREVG